MALALAGAALAHVSARAATHRVALVVEHGSSWPGPRVIWKCVEFAQDAINGLALLELAGENSGQPPQVYDWGGGADTVCQIAREPATVPDRCFGPTSGPNWSDWSMSGGTWRARSTGVTGYSLRDGDVEGWTYTAGFGAQPPAVAFSQVCTPSPIVAAPTRAATPAPVSATAAPQPTAATVSASSGVSPSLEAIAPSASATSKAALAVTGPAAHGPAPPSSSGAWLVLFLGSTLLVALGAVNLLRRGP